MYNKETIIKKLKDKKTKKNVIVRGENLKLLDDIAKETGCNYEIVVSMAIELLSEKFLK